MNPPLERGSTLLMPDIEALYRDSPSYGRGGLAVHRELEDGLCTLEGASFAQLTPNGLSACALAAASTVRAG
ncbi:MAG: cystathionine beta-lyase, partial [Pseudomonadota bacterium]